MMKRNSILFTLIITVLLIAACSHKSKEQIYAGTLEGTTIQVPALTGGKITHLLVDEGQLVQKDSTIAIIDTEDLQYQIQQLQANLTSLTASEKIAQNNTIQADKDMKYIYEKYMRTKELYQTQASSQQTLDDITNQKEKASSFYFNSTESLKQILGNIKQVNAQISSVQKKIRDAVIKAPSTGTITTKYYEVGEAIPPLGNIVELVNTQVLDVKIYVSVKMLNSLKLGQEVTLRTEGNDKKYKGNIEWVSKVAEFTPKNVLTPETRSSLVYAVKIKVVNPNDELKQGMPVEVKLPNMES
jgi:HlyD family secretion protein